MDLGSRSASCPSLAADGNVVAGNRIGMDATGSIPVPNQRRDRDRASSDNTIGGSTAAAGNLITDNGGPGVEVRHTLTRSRSAVRRDLRSSRRSATRSRPIASSATPGRPSTWASPVAGRGLDGSTMRSAPEQGPEQLPELPDHRHHRPSGQLGGWLGGSTPDTSFRIDFFASAAYGPGVGRSRGLPRIDGRDDRRERGGRFAVPFTAPVGLPIITATATDPEGNTSEVSAVRAAALSRCRQPHFCGPGPAVDLLGRVGRMPSRSRTRMPGRWTPAWDITLSVTAGTLRLSQHRGPDRVGRWDGLVILQRPTLGDRRGAGWPDLHSARRGACPCHARRRRNGRLAVTAAGKGRPHGRRLRGDHHGRQRPGLAPPGDPGCQCAAAGRSRSTSPSRARRPDHRADLAPARDHDVGGHRRDVSAGLRRHAADRLRGESGDRPTRCDRRRQPLPSVAWPWTGSRSTRPERRFGRRRPGTGRHGASPAARLSGPRGDPKSGSSRPRAERSDRRAAHSGTYTLSAASPGGPYATWWTSCSGRPPPHSNRSRSVPARPRS